MNKIYNISKFHMICLMLFSICIFAACDKDDDNNSQIVLNSFGPSPALRGGELRFIGVNLDKVQSIEIPGSTVITEITKVGDREIKVTIPQDALVGKVKLNTPQGVIETATVLTYEEPIIVDKITTELIKAGEEFTIEGDYLNLIKEVIFSSNIVVNQEDFVSQTRKKIVVLVPEEAQPGKIRVSNGAEMPIEVYSEESANVVEPVITALTPLQVKAEESLTIKGTDLNLIATIIFSGGKEVSEFTVNNEQIVVNVPADAQDGTITLVAKSGLEYVSTEELTLIVPTNLSVAPAKGIKPGDIITITGKNIDLITSFLFPGMEETTVPQSVNDTEVKVAFPDAAYSGELIINLGSGKTVSVEVETQKPVVSSYNPSPVTAGSILTIQGTDMDLIGSVEFGEEIVAEVESATLTALTVKVPVGSPSGEPVLVMKNSERVKAPSLEIVSPVFCFIPELPAGDEEIKSGTILVVNVENGDKLTNVTVNGNSTQFILQGSELHVLVPISSNGATTFTLISSNGEVSYTIDIIYSGKVETVILDEETDLGAWSNSFRLNKKQFKDVGFKAGSILRFYLTRTGDWPQIQINHANWGALTMPEGSDVIDITDVVFTQEMIDTMMGQDDGWSDTALVIQGASAIIHKVSTIVEN
ncbi:IPT/TIG domain-containing protein [Bacteroides sp. 519]|uniref:IPT/TIG domain-containing protein n=1 Tax=Bacteroides sp. 519 TaxID=2302937 RepID=UPI0013D04E24|nr:IPT/TIG domain-containing protein [Bacteroides sp. 519]NDV60565.1 hypothetical protein [Bacteroides sp. 519]